MRILLALAIILLSPFAVFGETPPANPGNGSPALGVARPGDDIARQNKLKDLVVKLDKIVLGGQHSGVVYETYSHVREAMVAGKLQFFVQGADSSHRLILGASFLPRTEGPSYILCTAELMDASQAQPGFALAIMMNAVVFAERYFSDPKIFMDTYKDDVESYLNSMDAIYVEALFVRNYILPAFGKLSDYERFLAEGVASDNLAGASTFILGVDQTLVYDLLHSAESAEAKKSSIDDVMNSLQNAENLVETKIAAAKDLFSKGTLGEAAREDRDRSACIAVVSALSLLKHGVKLVNRALAAFGSAPRSKTVQDAVQNFNTMLDGLIERIQPFVTSYTNYRTAFQNKLGL